MAKPNLERVVWSEGMLMCPQHLQQQDLFYEATLAARLSAIAPLHWGIVAVELDPGALKAGQLKVEAFRGILPDGLPVEFAPNDVGAPSSRPIEEHFPATASAIEVYLGVPTAREGIPNVAADGDNGARARFLLTSRAVTDLTVAKTEQSVGFGRANLVVLFGDEDREDFEAVKVAELVRDETGALAQSPTYIAPCLRISASNWLSNQVQELLSVMVTKQRSLADRRRQRDAANVEFASDDVTKYLLLAALNSQIPVLRHVVDQPTISPLALYLVLVQLGGQLTSFAGDVDPTSFPRFVFTDLRATFGPLFETLAAMLGATVKETCITVPLEARKDGMWIGTLKDDRLLKCPRYVLAVEAEQPEQEVANRLPKLSKIASWKQIPQIVQSATPGVPLTSTHRPPPEVPIRPKLVYFMLGTDDEYWKQVLSERTVAIYLPRPYDPSKAKLTLMGVPARPSR